MTDTKTEPPAFGWAVPEELGIPPDPIRLRLDFFHQSTEMTIFGKDSIEKRLVSAMDVSLALSSELSFNTGLLPPGTIWWQNTKHGALYALYVEPGIRKLALQVEAGMPPYRFTIPLPGFIFLCFPSQPPWVFAVKKKPTKEKDIVYKAPLCNIFSNGRSCPGSHRYPARVADIVESFFVSYFTTTAELSDRSRKYPDNVVRLWKSLDKKKKFPMQDLVEQCTVKDLLMMEIR